LAGGYVSGADGENDLLTTGWICCGDEIMHRELLALLASLNAGLISATVRSGEERSIRLRFRGAVKRGLAERPWGERA
jgi:hypothetical protein